MTRSEIALLLGAIAGRDQRTIGESDVLAWHEDLADLDFADARDAVRRHFRESTDRIMPAHVRHLVKVIRSERRDQHEIRALPSRYEPDVSRSIRMERGTSQVHEILAQINARLAAQRGPTKTAATPSDEIRQRALERAAAEKRTRPLHP